MKIAIISDLHVGCAARGKDYCPAEDTESRAIDQNYQKLFIDFILEESISANYLLMPGDLSNRSKFTEVDLGTKIIYEIAEALGVSRDHILSVPGNHDVDWSMYKGLTGGEREARKALRYQSLIRDSSLFINAQSANNLLFSSPYYRIWEFEDAIIVGSNSGWQDDPDSPIHHGSIIDDCIKQIEESLKGVKGFKDKLKIFLIHHHPINYSDPVYYPDHSIMHNAENLLKMLMRNSFDFLVHGHKHVPKFKTLKENSGFPLNILCAGSFSALLDTKLSGYVNNQFHLIDIHSRDDSTKNANGLLKSWTFLSQRGWSPSQKNNGIEHILPFGADVQPAYVEKLLRQEIKDAFATKSHFKMHDFWRAHPNLRYLPTDSLKIILDGLKDEMNYEVHETHKEIILLKNE